MAKRTFSDKVERVLKFLLALRDRRINTLLRAYGFDQASYDEGLQLLHAAIGPLLDFSGPEAPVEPHVLRALDEWENKWFPIAKASLQRQFPEVHDKVFLNLSQAQGPGVVISVGTFIRRLDALGVTADGCPDERDLAARKLLERRGLDEAELAPVRALLAQAGSLEDVPDVPPAPHPDPKAAEDALWAWYLEWSIIARQVITDGRLLQRLGFRKSGRPARSPQPTRSDLDAASEPVDDLLDEDEDAEEDEPVA